MQAAEGLANQQHGADQVAQVAEAADDRTSVRGQSRARPAPDKTAAAGAGLQTWSPSRPG
jgi:hypothetical protein